MNQVKRKRKKHEESKIPRLATMSHLAAKSLELKMPATMNRMQLV
jgi:hypothetical protein